MADLRNYQMRSGVQTHADASIDEGLRSYMLKVYNLMALGLAITGLAAWGGFNFAVQDGQLTQFGQLLFVSPLKWVVMLAPLGLVFFLSFRINKMSVAAAQTTFWVYAALVGLSLSTIFLVYTQTSIVRTFFITASAFGALSLYGYTTKRDLQPIGVVAIFALWGIVGMSLLSFLFPPSGFFETAVTVGVLAISGVLVAFDTQNLKRSYFAFEGDERGLAVMTNWGALNFFILFYNIFVTIMSLLSRR